MKPQTFRWFRVFHSPLAVASATLLICCCPRPTAAGTPPEITSVAAAKGTVRLTWTGDAYAYEVQTTTSLQSPNWLSVVATARTNAALPLGGNAAFFRVVTPETNVASLVITTTNLATGDVYTFTREPQTNADLVFDNFADTNAATPVMEVLAAADVQQFDFQFDGTGGFLIVSSNGTPSGFGGVMFVSPGPGSTQTSFQGLLTNGVGAVSFSAVADSAPGRTALKDGGDSTGGAALGVGDAALSGFWCASAWAAQNLGCQSGCLSKGVACVGFFPPHFNLEGYCYISSRTGVSWNSTGTAIVGTCDSHCVSCCRDKNTHALSDCTP